MILHFLIEGDREKMRGIEGRYETNGKRSSGRCSKHMWNNCPQSPCAAPVNPEGSQKGSLLGPPSMYLQKGEDVDETRSEKFFLVWFLMTGGYFFFNGSINEISTYKIICNN